MKDNTMASKLFNSTKSLAIANGMTVAQAHYLARMASGHANEVGLGEVSIDDIGAKSSTKGFTTTVKSAHKRELRKGELLTVGEVAFLFSVWLRDSAKAWPCVLRNVSLPTGLTAAYVEAIRQEAATLTKKARETDTKAKEISFDDVEKEYENAWLEEQAKAKAKATLAAK